MNTQVRPAETFLSFEEWVVSHGTWGPQELGMFWQQLAMQIAALHEQDILHGNLVPASLEMSAAGLPRLLPLAAELPHSLELAAELVPPEIREQIPDRLPRSLAAASVALSRPGEVFDARRIDVYQLGALVVQIAAGATADEYIRRPLVSAKIPAALRPIVDRAIGTSPDQRLTTCTEILAELAMVIADAEVMPRSGASPAKDKPARETPSRGVDISSDTDLNRKQRELAQRKRETGELPFDRLGSYEIVARLGSGGMGDVFKGYDASLDRFVAIKVLPLEFARQEDFVGRFRAEAAAAAKVEHPNIVPIYTIGSDQDRHFFAMQFVDGQTLGQLLAQQTKLPPERTLQIVEQIASGLAAAHLFGLVHRDIKPGNILLADGGRRALVADFGLVKSMVQDKGMTATGVVMGTVDYISPEQGRGKGVDGRADLYSVGVLMYQMLAGRLPFSADTPTAMIFQHAYEPPPPLLQAAPEVPPLLAGIVHKLLAKSPSERYQTCEDLLDDLAAYSAGASPPHLSGAAASRETGPRTAIILAPKFADHPPAAEIATEPILTPSIWTWEHARQYLFFWLKQKAPELVRHLENTQQQVDGAVFEYQQRCDSLGRLVREAEAVQQLLEVQLREHQSAEAEARLRLAKATDDATLVDARAACTANAEAAAQLGQQIVQQRDELELMQLEFAKVSSKLTRLKSQRDALNARLKVAQARYGLADARKQHRWRSPYLAVAGVSAIACILVVIYFGSRNLVPQAPTAAALPEQSPEKTPPQPSPPSPSPAAKGPVLDLVMDDARLQTFLPSPPTFIQFTEDTFDEFSNFVVGSQDGTLLNLTVNKGRLESRARRIGEHARPVAGMAWNRSSNKLASVSPDGDIQIHQLPQGTLFRRLAQGSDVQGLAFSADGNQLLAAGISDVRLWDVLSGNELQRYLEPQYRGQASSVAWLPDESGFVEGGRIFGAPAAYVVNIEGTKWLPMQIKSATTNLAVMHGGRDIIGLAGNSLHIWRATDGADLSSFGSEVTCVAYSQNARRALTGHGDGTVRLWDTTTGTSVQEYRMPGRVHAIGISKRSLFGVAANAKEIRLFVLPPETVPYLKRRFDSPSPIQAMAISPSQFRAISVGDQQVHSWNLEDVRIGNGPINGAGPASVVAYATDGTRYLLARSQPDRQGFGGIVLRNVTSRGAGADSVLRRYQGHKGGTNAAVFARNSTRIISGGTDNYVREWETSTEQELDSIDVGIAVRGLAATPDGKQVAVVGDGSVNCDVWSLETKQRIGVLAGHSLAPRSVVWARNAPRVATISGDRTARVWDPETFTSLAVFDHPTPVTAVDISSDGKWLMTGGQDGYLRVWNVQTKEAGKSWWAHESPITATVFAADGKTVVSAGQDQVLNWWDFPAN